MNYRCILAYKPRFGVLMRRN